MTAVSDALELAFQRQIVRWRGGGRQPSIASIAAEAGVSRQNVYKSHSSFVAKLRREIGQHGRGDPLGGIDRLALLRRALAAERKKVEALARLCAELAAELLEVRQEKQIEIETLRAQLSFVRAVKKRVSEQ